MTGKRGGVLGGSFLGLWSRISRDREGRTEHQRGRGIPSKGGGNSQVKVIMDGCEAGPVFGDRERLCSVERSNNRGELTG